MNDFFAHYDDQAALSDLIADVFWGGVHKAQFQDQDLKRRSRLTRQNVGREGGGEKTDGIISSISTTEVEFFVH